MSWERFWMYSDTYEAMGGEGFGYFSVPHLLWLAFLAAAIALCVVLYRRSGEERRADLRKGLAVFLILFEIFKQCTVTLTGAPNIENLPMELCSFAEYAILIDALWPENTFLKQMLAFVFLPSALVTLFFPSIMVYPPLNFYAVHQFLLHGAIVAYILSRCAAGEIRVRYAGLWQALAGALFLIVPMFFLDRALGVNFMFLTYHEGNPALQAVWNITGGCGGLAYLLGLAVLVTAVLHLTYAVFAAAYRVSGRIAGQVSG